jgi:hypothetical protein
MNKPLFAKIISIVFLIIFIFAFSIYFIGPQKSSQFETVALYSKTFEVTSGWSYVQISTESIPLFVNDSLIIAEVSPTRTINFCFLNETEFKDWKINENVSNSIFCVTIENAYNYSIPPEEANYEHYFVFQNTENATVNTNFLVLVSGDFLRFNYSIEFEALIFSIITFGISLIVIIRFRLISKLFERWYIPKVKTSNIEKNWSTYSQNNYKILFCFLNFF